MSRKYMNDRWCVRCGRKNACPYLRDNMTKIIKMDETTPDDRLVVDIGCGNGRNSEYMASVGFSNIISLDMADDFGIKCILGVDPIPVNDKKVDILLCNYSIMFLDHTERKFLYKEIQRVASKDCLIMVELYAAKDSYAKTKEEMIVMLDEILEGLGEGWKKLRYARKGGKFIAQYKSLTN